MDEKDTSGCFDREAKCFGYKVRFDKNMVHNRLQTLMTHGASYVAEYKKKIVGHITSFYTKTGDIYLEFLCVDDDKHRKGIGRTLIRKLEDDNQRSNIYLRTGSNNQPAIKFYLSMGYEIHEVKGDDWKYKDIVMVLKRK